MNCCRGHGAPSHRLESRPCLPGGCTGRTWRGHAYLRHGYGPHTPPRAQGMAVGQPSHTGGRSDAIESLGVYRSGLAIAVQYVCECRMGFVPSRVLQVDAQDAVPRRTGSVGLVPGYQVDAPRAVREAVRRTPASCRGQTCGRPSHRVAMRAPPSWVLSRDALWSDAGMRDVAVTPGGQRRKGRDINLKRATDEVWAHTNATDLKRPNRATRERSWSSSGLLVPRPTGPSPLGHSRPSSTFSPLTAH
jgi:hypothetical protein